MATIKEQIELIRAEIDKTQKNKATNAHIGKLKAKIAQLKLKEEKAMKEALNLHNKVNAELLHWIE